jgi:hypothetical protein
LKVVSAGGRERAVGTHPNVTAVAKTQNLRTPELCHGQRPPARPNSEGRPRGMEPAFRASFEVVQRVGALATGANERLWREVVRESRAMI